MSPSQCDVRRDDGELYDVHGGDEVQDDDVSWAHSVYRSLHRTVKLNTFADSRSPKCVVS